ncbi:MAG TPA: LON peptidase substrate-binding domain-containing protein [Gammaproteobacteria bacterium]|nr:LON peptidase substrate-binding domain-containing protein [Gammaproteobacteria bacterium]
MSIEIPLFPLKSVLFPGGPLRLRIFEPRYIDMVARCLRADNRFGIVAISRGAEVGEAEMFGAGTLAEIVDWHQDGALLGIVVVGREGFRLESTRRQPDGLYVGRAALREREPRRALAEAHAPLAALLRGLLEPLSSYRTVEPAYDDAVWVSYRLTEVLPLALPLKQELLEMNDSYARLDRIAASLPPQSSA